MGAIPTPIAGFKTTLTSKLTDVATSMILDSVTDDAGNSLDGMTLAFCIDKGTAKEETVLGVVTASTKTVALSIRGMDTKDGSTQVTALKFEHRKKAPVEITDHPYLLRVIRILNGTDGIDPAYRPKLSSDVDTTDNKQFVTTAQLNRAALGSISTSNLIAAGVGGATIAAGNLIYLKLSDLEWYLVDADDAATCENVVMGIAQGAGTDGVAITGGILLFGIDTHQTGLSGDTQYASNTAGGISNTPGTKEVAIGVRVNGSTTSLYFNPRFPQQITEDEQDALAGSSGTPSGANKFITQLDAVRAPIFGVSAAGTDAYAITPTPAITAYADGQEYCFKADVANTDGATFAVSALAAKAIVDPNGSALTTGTIVANQYVMVRYRATQDNFVMVSPSAALSVGITTPRTDLHAHKRNSVTTTYDISTASGNQVIAHGLGVLPNWVRVTILHRTNDESIGCYERVGAVYSTAARYTGASEGNTQAVLTDKIARVASGSGASQDATVGSLDATNLTLAWVKTGSPSGTAYMLIEVGI